MRPPSPTLRYLRRALDRGDIAVIQREGDRLAAAVAAASDRHHELAELALLLGAAHAADDHLTVAEAYLEAGLERAAAIGGVVTDPAPGAAGARRWIDRPAPASPPAEPAGGPDPGAGAGVPPPAPLPPMPPPGPAPWERPMPRDTDPWAELDGGSPPAPRGEVPRAPFVDWCELLLCEVHLRTGRTAEATDRLVTLVEPHRDEAIRFAALRAQAVVAALGGRYERAHHLLNSAGGVAARIPSRHRGALVERDRALVLAGEGRVHEALAIAERVATPLIRPVAGPHQRWSRLEAASMALALARTVTRTGDELSGRRLLAMGEAALAGVHAPFLDAHRALARAVVLGPDGEPGEIEDLLTRATTTFEHAGDRPAAALVAREHGRLAHVRGLERSARPFYVQAAAELRSYGWTVDAAEADRLRAALDAGHPPPFRYGNVP